MTREEWDEYKRHLRSSERVLLERIKFHRQKLIEEKPGWSPPASWDEWIAFHEARLARAERAA